MSLRSSGSDLPIIFSEVGIVIGKTTILSNISLTIAEGTPTILVGPNGSGKTTLLHAAMGLIAPSRGEITWGGHEASPPLQRAIVFQRPVMLRRSAAKNIDYALAAAGIPHSKRQQHTSELLALVGLSDIRDRPARRLSGGEQQRLALARALARAPAILFLDEPTASLDPAATKAIEEIVRVISARNVKIVMATHDLGEARRLAGEIIFMHRGTVIESGPADRFFKSPATEGAKRFLAGELLV